MAKHFMIYYKQGTGTYVVTEPRPWARENQQPHFAGRDFVNNHPTTEEIEDYLINNFGFVVGHDDGQIKLIHNLDPGLGI